MKTTFAAALAIAGAQAHGTYGAPYNSYMAPAPTYQHMPYPASYPMHNHFHSHGAPDPFDPYATPTQPQEDPAKATWYTPYQQYSTPKIAYTPAPLERAVFANCGQPTWGSIQLAQLPGKAAMVKFNVSGLDPDTLYGFMIHEYGNLGTACANVGKEFNPLCEKDSLGRPNPYQDPSRGTIENQTTDATGAITDVIQTSLLQNMAGKNSIVGRSIVVHSDPEGANGIVDCCIIGLEADPQATVTHNHAHSHYEPHMPGYYPSTVSYPHPYQGYGPSPRYYGGQMSYGGAPMY